MLNPEPRIIFDTSALLDLFGRWTGDYKQRRGDLVREVHVLAPLRPFLFSSQAIREEVHQLLAIGTELAKYVTFESVTSEELSGCPGYVKNREADYSLIALTKRFEHQGFLPFLISRDRTFVPDLARAGLSANVVPPTGFAEAVTILATEGGQSGALAHRIQNNAFENLSNSMRLARRTRGDSDYYEWQEFLNSRTAAKHELIDALKATRVRL